MHKQIKISYKNKQIITLLKVERLKVKCQKNMTLFHANIFAWIESDLTLGDRDKSLVSK